MFFVPPPPPFFLQGFVLKRHGDKSCYIRGQQRPGPEGRPQGFLREEFDGDAGYYIGEFVDGKRHGHEVYYGTAGDVQREGDYVP